MLLSGALGMAVSAEKKREMKVFAQFYDFNEKLIINLKYGKDKVGKIAEEFDYVQKVMRGGEVIKGEEGDFLKSYIKYMLHMCMFMWHIYMHMYTQTYILYIVLIRFFFLST